MVTYNDPKLLASLVKLSAPSLYVPSIFELAKAFLRTAMAFKESAPPFASLIEYAWIAQVLCSAFGSILLCLQRLRKGRSLYARRRQVDPRFR